MIHKFPRTAMIGADSVASRTGIPTEAAHQGLGHRANRDPSADAGDGEDEVVTQFLIFMNSSKISKGRFSRVNTLMSSLPNLLSGWPDRQTLLK